MTLQCSSLVQGFPNFFARDIGIARGGRGLGPPTIKIPPMINKFWQLSLAMFSCSYGQWGSPGPLTNHQEAPKPLTNHQEALGPLTDSQGPLTDKKGPRGPEQGALGPLIDDQGAPGPLTNDQEGLGPLTDNQGALGPLTDKRGPGASNWWTVGPGFLIDDQGP